ncbi:hypothetical protein ACFL6S_37105 [Candidatus Poribacteria bacterium]
MKILAIFVLMCMFCLPIAAMSQQDTMSQQDALTRQQIGLPEWTFDDMAELADWQDYHNLDLSSTITKVRDSKGGERNVLTLEAIGDNPYVYPGGSVPNWEPFRGYEYATIYIGVRVKESDEWQVDYIVNRNEDYDGARTRTFRVDATEDFVDLEFEMEWDDMISGFRIHPGADKNKNTEIDYVSLRGPVQATQAPRRLATTWGRIKDLF